MPSPASRRCCCPRASSSRTGTSRRSTGSAGTTARSRALLRRRGVQRGHNGIVAFDEPWKNVCATLYHELQEARTDPDVEDAIRTGDNKYLGWYSPRGGEIGDIPIATAPLQDVMREVPLADGSGTVPVQLMWSNRAGGPAAS